MESGFSNFVHPRHYEFFVEAARMHDCYILVRQTGAASIHWIGKEGYTGKRVDMKAKTAKMNVGHYQLAGLVCSPEIHPGAFTDQKSAKKYWDANKHLISIPPNQSGFKDYDCLKVQTPYVLQNNPGHKHYGCIALVEYGLLVPRYVHGDYDLYGIIPAGNRYNAQTHIRQNSVGPNLSHKSLAEQVEAEKKFGSKDFVGPLTDKIADFINTKIATLSSDYVGALMVNHGEQLNMGESGITHEPVLAFLGRNQGGHDARIISGVTEHAQFFDRIKRGI